MQNIWVELSKSLGCGGCSNITTVESPHTCKTCGRMLCGSCGEFCKDHAPNKRVQSDGADSAREYEGFDITGQRYGKWVIW